jgi:hypothetical protein
MPPLRLTLAVAAWALIAAAPVRADAPDTAALQKEIQALKATVQALESRVSQLEAGAAGSSPRPTTAPADAPLPLAAGTDANAAPTAPSEAPAPVVPAGTAYTSPEATLRSNWAQVTRGMDQQAVTRLLGAPSMKSTLDGRTVWFYTYPGTGRGSVFFTDAGKVSSRQSPFGLGW